MEPPVNRKHVVLVGGSGFLGAGLRQRLMGRRHDVTVIGRGRDQQHNGWRHVQWDSRSIGPWVQSLDGADALVHLSGKRVDCRPTKANIDELIRSREETVQLVGRALADLSQQPTAWIQLSSLAIFGEGGDEVIDETTVPPATGPRQMVEVCQRWEAAFEIATADIDRTVLLRPGIGIGGAGDPATERLLQLARLGLAGRVGSGRQWVSWLAAIDFVDILERAVLDEAMSGLYHLTAPNPVRNEEMMRTYREAAGRSFGLPSPKLITKIGAWLLGSDPGLALIGRRCVPGRLINEGYEFKVPDFADAVAEAVAATKGQ